MDNEMKEKKDQPRAVSTCFEGCAEMMQKIMGEGGIGSLCEEMMRSLAKGIGGGPQEPPEGNRPAGEEKADPGSQAAQGRDKNQQNGGVK